MVTWIMKFTILKDFLVHRYPLQPVNLFYTVFMPRDTEEDLRKNALYDQYGHVL